MTASYHELLEAIYEEVQPLIGQGQVANYIPALARVNPDNFAMAVRTVSGEEFTVGSADTRFSIQSISKVFTLTLAMRITGESLWSRVGRNPSGTAFNSLVQLEYENGVPRNPFINAGALVVTDSVVSQTADATGLILQFVRQLANRSDISFDFEVADSEQEYGHRNAALAHFMKSYGNMYDTVERTLSVYFRQCAIAMSCRELACAFGYLANDGVAMPSGEAVLSKGETRRVNSLLQSCGMYEAVGEFAYRVGLPGKSGVGGGIVAIAPRQMSLCVWSPGLDPAGNSLAGVRALELFCERTGISIF